MNCAVDHVDISNFYNHHTSLMNFWHSKIPESIHTVEYEKIVLDKKNETEQLLKFCELEWDDNCLNHHKNDMPIKTLSLNQANKPIYSSSINSAKNFQPSLKEIFSSFD